MKIFISWSGEPSRVAALALHDCLKKLFADVEPWVSSADIRQGEDWFAALSDVLAESRYAILCLTQENVAAPWLLFEAGAIAGKAGHRRLTPLLIGVDSDDVGEPLSKFQQAAFKKDAVRTLIFSINMELGERKVPEDTLKLAFEGAWPKLNKAAKAAVAASTVKAKYDVFLSVPMAVYDEAEYQQQRAEVLKVLAALRDKCKLTVFCAIDDIKTLADFDVHAIGAKHDIEALENSAHFMMIYPRKLATSSIFEAGYALARRLPILLFVRDDSDLPFLMKQLPGAFENCSICDGSTWKTYDDIAKQLVKNKSDWFYPARESARSDSK